MKYFIKHVPSNLRARFVEERLGRPGLRVMATDYTSFESHFTRDMMEDCEFQLYEFMTRHLMEGPEWYRTIKELLGTNHCKFRNVKALVEAGRMSGEMNTSLGNSFTNLMMYLFIHEQLGNTDADCLIEGDDCLGVYNGKDPTAAMYSELGFTVKIEFPKSINSASFCGQIFTSNHVVVTDPIKTYLNIGWAPRIYASSSAKTRRELLNSKARSLLYEHSGAPVVTSLARYILKHTTHYRVIAQNGYEKQKVLTACKAPLVYKPVSMEARELVQDLFGVPILAQILAEKWFDEQDGLRPLTCPYLIPYVPKSSLEYDRDHVTYEYSLKNEQFPIPGPAAIDPALLKYYASQKTEITTTAGRAGTYKT